jgi:hypothetical protein
MTNKPNLYVFAIDISGSMSACIEQVNRYIETFVKNKKDERNSYIRIILFNSNITFNEVFELNNFNWKLSDRYIAGTVNIADITLIMQEIDIIIKEYQQKYILQEAILITDINIDKESIKQISFKQLFEDIKLYDIKIPINVRDYKFFFASLLFGFIVFFVAFLVIINLKQNKVTDFNVQIKNEFKIENYVKIQNDFNVKFDVNFIVNTDNFFIPQYFFEYSMQAQNIEGEILYYPKGAYDLENPNCKCPTSVNFAKLIVEKIKTDLEKDYLKGNKIKLNVTGETDASIILQPYIYKYEGKDTTLAFCLNGNNEEVKFKNNQLIKNNETLACLRSYSISKYLVHNLPIIAENKRNIIHFANTNKIDKGGKYRKTKIVIIVKDYSLVYHTISIIVLVMIILGMWYLFVKYFRGTLFKNLISIKIGNIFGGND